MDQNKIYQVTNNHSDTQIVTHPVDPIACRTEACYFLSTVTQTNCNNNAQQPGNNMTKT